MEAPEVPTEHLHEHLQEHAEQTAEGHGHGSKASWVMGAALSSAILAVMAAVASLLAGYHVNEAMIDQLRASDQWNYYQAKGVKAAVLSSKIELLTGLQKPVSEKDKEKISQYAEDQKKIKEMADELQKSADGHLKTHVVFAKGVTLFQVSIAVAAVSVLTQKRLFWFVSMAFGAIGLIFLVQGLMLMFH